jgi:hypothetical protein
MIIIEIQGHILVINIYIKEIIITINLHNYLHLYKLVKIGTNWYSNIACNVQYNLRMYRTFIRMNNF